MQQITAEVRRRVPAPERQLGKHLPAPTKGRLAGAESTGAQQRASAVALCTGSPWAHQNRTAAFSGLVHL